MTLDMGNTDKLADFRQRGAAARHRRSCRRRSTARARLRRRATARILYALAALKGVGAPAVEHIVDGARRAAVHAISPTSPRASIRASSTSARWKAWPPPAPSTSSSPTARGVRRRRAHDRRSRSARARDAAVGPERSVRRRRRARAAAATAGRSSRGCRPSGCSANSRRSASTSPAIRSTTTRRRCKRLRVQTWAEFAAAVRRRREPPARLAGDRASSRSERRTKTGNKIGLRRLLRPDRPVRGGDVLRRCWRSAATLLEPGAPVLLQVEAERDGEDVQRCASRASSRSTGRRGKPAAACGSILSPSREPLAKRLTAACWSEGAGEVESRSCCSLDEAGARSRSSCPAAIDVSPQIAGRAQVRVPGVVAGPSDAAEAADIGAGLRRCGLRGCRCAAISSPL